VGILAIIRPEPEIPAEFMRYVPGFGLKDGREVRFSATGSVRLDRGEQWIEVRGVRVTDKEIRARVYAHGVELTRGSISLVTEEGRALKPSSWFSSGSDYMEAWVPFAGPIPAGSRKVTVVIKDTPEWRLEVPLITRDQLTTVDAFGPSATVGPFTVSAQVIPSPERTAVMLLIRGLQKGAWAHAPELTLSAGDWTSEPERPGSGNSEPPLFYYDAQLPTDSGSVTLSVPYLDVTEPGETKVTLKAADATLNQDVQLGAWTVRITRTQLISPSALGPDEGKQSLRVYVEPSSAYLRGFDLGRTMWDHLFSFSNGYSFAAKQDEATGRIIWLDVPVRDGAKSETITLSDPEVRIPGPWVITVPLGKSRQ
jgi:hypothetical protein